MHPWEETDSTVGEEPSGSSTATLFPWEVDDAVVLDFPTSSPIPTKLHPWEENSPVVSFSQPERSSPTKPAGTSLVEELFEIDDFLGDLEADGEVQQQKRELEDQKRYLDEKFQQQQRSDRPVSIDYVSNDLLDGRFDTTPVTNKQEEMEATYRLRRSQFDQLLLGKGEKAKNPIGDFLGRVAFQSLAGVGSDLVAQWYNVTGRTGKADLVRMEGQALRDTLAAMIAIRAVGR